MAADLNAQYFPYIEEILTRQTQISKSGKSKVAGSARSFDMTLSPVDMAYFKAAQVTIDPRQQPLAAQGLSSSLLEMHTAMAVNPDAAYQAQVEKGARDISAKGKAAIVNLTALLNDYMMEKTGTQVTLRYDAKEANGIVGGHFHMAPQPATSPKIAQFTAVIQGLQRIPGASIKTPREL